MRPAGPLPLAFALPQFWAIGAWLDVPDWAPWLRDWRRGSRVLDEGLRWGMKLELGWQGVADDGAIIKEWELAGRQADGEEGGGGYGGMGGRVLQGRSPL